MGYGTGGNISTGPRIHPLKSRLLGKTQKIGVFLKEPPYFIWTHQKSFRY